MDSHIDVLIAAEARLSDRFDPTQLREVKVSSVPLIPSNMYASMYACAAKPHNDDCFSASSMLACFDCQRRFGYLTHIGLPHVYKGEAIGRRHNDQLFGEQETSATQTTPVAK